MSIRAFFYGASTWCKLSSRSAACIESLRVHVCRTIYRMHNVGLPAEDRTSDTQVIQKAKLTAATVVIRCERLRYFRRYLITAPPALVALTAAASIHGQSWLQIIIDDLRWLAGSSPEWVPNSQLFLRVFICGPPSLSKVLPIGKALFEKSSDILPPSISPLRAFSCQAKLYQVAPGAWLFHINAQCAKNSL